MARCDLPSEAHEYACREHGHFDCATLENGYCHAERHGLDMLDELHETCCIPTKCGDVDAVIGLPCDLPLNHSGNHSTAPLRGIHNELA